MDLSQRLNALGMNKSQFAERLGISAAAVSQWKELPEKAEKLLAKLEGNPVSDHISVNALVKDDQGRECRVVRRDRCESLNDKVTWIYWVSPARRVEGGYHPVGPTVSMPEKFLTLIDNKPVWVEKVDRGKVEKE